jgi:hypothetical protein
MFRPHRSDRNARGFVSFRDLTATRRLRQDPESGQATTEFALILLPLMLLVSGIIWFGIGLNYWLDMQRLANQGARWAVVNSWPTCPRSSATTLAPHPSDGCTTTLQRYIACQPVAAALKPSTTVSFPSGTSATKRGDPVKVSLTTPFRFVPIVNLGTVTLQATATMRLEQDASRFNAGSYAGPPCP